MKFRAFIDADSERLNGINKMESDIHDIWFEDNQAWNKSRVSPSNHRNIIERDYETKL